MWLLGTSWSENRKGNFQRDVQGNIMYIETQTYRIGGWSSHPDKGSGVMKWVLVKWPKEPASKDPLETGFKSVLRHWCFPRTLSTLFPGELKRSKEYCQTGHCMAACRGPYYEGKGPRTLCITFTFILKIRPFFCVKAMYQGYAERYHLKTDRKSPQDSQTPSWYHTNSGIKLIFLKLLPPLLWW